MYFYRGLLGGKYLFKMYLCVIVGVSLNEYMMYSCVCV